MWISTEKVTLLFSHVRMQITFSCLLPSQEKGQLSCPHLHLSFLLYIFCLVTRTSHQPFCIRDRTLLGCPFVFKKPNLPPLPALKNTEERKTLSDLQRFSELSESFLFHQEPQNKAGSDGSVWSQEIPGTDAGQHSMCHYPRDKFPPIYLPGFVSLFFDHIVLPLCLSQCWGGTALRSKLINSKWIHSIL